MSTYSDDVLAPYARAARRIEKLYHMRKQQESLEQTKILLQSENPQGLPNKMERLLVQAVSSDYKLVIDLLVGMGAVSSDLSLHNCVITGNEHLVTAKLRTKPDLEIRDEIGRTPLLQAVIRGLTDMVSIMIEAGADVNSRDNCGLSSIDYAILEGNIRIIRILLKANARANIADGMFHLEPVFLTLSQGQNRPAVLKLIVMKYTSLLNKQNNEGLTPLAVATSLGLAGVVDVLLDQESIILNPRDKTTRQTPLHLAAKRGDARIAASLLARRASVDAKDYNNQTPLYLACEQGYANCVQAILDQGKPNKKEKYNVLALRVAICSYGADYDEIVELLTNYGITTSRDFVHDPEVLHAAVKNGYMKIVLSLLQSGANVDHVKDGRTLLHDAVLGNQEDVVILLINRGAKIDSKCALGKTPLYYSEERGYEAITRQLLDNSMDIRDDAQLLHKAVSSNNLEQCKSLLRHSDLNAYDDFGKAPIHYTPSVEMLDLLMKSGANINRASETGATIMHLAATLGDKELVSAILRHGGDIFSRDNQQRTPLAMAHKYKRQEVEDLLRNVHVRVLLAEQRSNIINQTSQPQTSSISDNNSVLNLSATPRVTSESNSNN